MLSSELSNYISFFLYCLETIALANFLFRHIHVLKYLICIFSAKCQTFHQNCPEEKCSFVLPCILAAASIVLCLLFLAVLGPNVDFPLSSAMGLLIPAQYVAKNNTN